MPLLTADAKGLELVACSYLSQDEVMINEILTGFDIHGDNQTRFGLPARVIAKIFVFRLIYGGTSYSYANDPDFNFISFDQAYWQAVIDAFYKKYPGIKEWHDRLLKEVGKNGVWTSPTGRQHTFVLNQWGKLPETIIKNYPVQGLGADIMMLVRISLFRRMKQRKLRSLLINTVHDNVVADCPAEELEEMRELITQVFDDIPENFERVFKKPFGLVQRVEFKT